MVLPELTDDPAPIVATGLVLPWDDEDLINFGGPKISKLKNQTSGYDLEGKSPIQNGQVP